MGFSSYLIKIALLSLLACLLFLPFPTDSLWWREFLNIGHVVLFFILTFFLYNKVNASSKVFSRINKYFFVLVVGLVFGVLIELVQSAFQREASASDLLKDFYGLMAGIVFLLAMHQKLKWKKNTLLTGVIIFLFLGTYSFFQMNWHYIQRGNAFPVIVAFGEPWALSFLRFNKVALLGESAVNNADGIKWFKLRFEPGLYPNVSVIEPENNWSAYSTLRFSVFSNNKENIKLVLRIHDEAHNQNHNDRFNQHYNIQPGLNAVVLKLDNIKHAPEYRDIDMTSITGVQLFLVNNKESLFLDVSNIALEM